MRGRPNTEHTQYQPHGARPERGRKRHKVCDRRCSGCGSRPYAEPVADCYRVSHQPAVDTAVSKPVSKRPFPVRTLNRKGPLTWEPPIGIEPMTYALRVRRSSRLS